MGDRFSVIAWLLLISALFVDSANITDLLPGSTTIHFEEMPGVGDDGVAMGSGVHRLAPPPDASSSRTNRTTRHPALVLLDQDSYSLAPSAPSCAETEVQHRPEGLSDSFQGESFPLIYLRNCSLLI
ncbi:MAG TPA: hypothetical protein VMM57_09555 [Bacteroidota bacterium]|nr:hypothetical protein [Bacteroidota bacterium]